MVGQMNRVLIVCCTVEAARSKFKDIVELYGSDVKKALFNQLTIEVDDIEYRFMSVASPLEKITGLMFHSVYVDDNVQLTNEQEAMIMSRWR